MSTWSALVAITLAACTAVVGSWHGRPAPPAQGWRTFEGSWTAAGSRHTIPTESGRPAAIVRLSGAVVLTRGTDLGRGFRGEVVAFDDGGTLGVGRAVWIDANGDRIYSELKGEPVETGRKITATITGGTGRYRGLSGDYAFTWRYLVDAGSGDVQGHTTGLAGRYKVVTGGQ